VTPAIEGGYFPAPCVKMPPKWCVFLK